MEFINEVVNFVVNAFLGLNALEIVLIVAIAVGLFLLTRLITAITTNEYVKANETLLALLGNTLFDAVMLVAWGKVDYSVYDQKAADYENEHGRWIDPRMWYVIDKAEAWLETYGFDVEFDELIARAEAIYRQAQLDGKLPPDELDDELPLIEV